MGSDNFPGSITLDQYFVYLSYFLQYIFCPSKLLLIVYIFSTKTVLNTVYFSTCTSFSRICFSTWATFSSTYFVVSGKYPPPVKNCLQSISLKMIPSGKFSPGKLLLENCLSQLSSVNWSSSPIYHYKFQKFLKIWRKSETLFNE